jgi:predicted dehydrogenase
MDRLRVGIIGLGRGRDHARKVAESPRCELVGIADIAEEAAQKAAEELKAPAHYKHYRQLLKAGNLDAVVISTPNHLHAPMSLDCMKAGLHVLVEKPMCNTMREADEIIRVAKRTKRKLLVGYNYRWNPAYQKTKEILSSGQLGKLLYANCVVKTWRAKVYYERAAWRTKWATQGGGVLMNQATHHLDSLSWWMGEAKAVIGFCENLYHEMEVEDTGSALIKFKSGATLNLVASTAIEGSLAPPYEFNGTDATLAFGMGGLVIRPKDAKEWTKVELPEGGDTTNIQLNAFLDCVLNDTPSPVPPADGRRALELSLAIYRSSYLRQPVNLPLRRGQRVHAAKGTAKKR